MIVLVRLNLLNRVLLCSIPLYMSNDIYVTDDFLTAVTQETEDMVESLIQGVDQLTCTQGKSFRHVFKFYNF